MNIQRKQEIRDTALQLFMTRGYSRTSIQNILDALPLSKGGFYHHYKSKEELVDAIAEERAESYLASWSDMEKRSDLSGMEKFLEVFRINNAIKTKNIQRLLEHWSALYSDENKLFRLKLLDKQIDKISPYMTPFIRQAITEGDFHTEHPEECIHLIILYSDSTIEKVLPYLEKAAEDRSVLPRIYEQYDFLFYMMERVLGAAEGSLNLFPEGYFEQIFYPAEE